MSKKGEGAPPDEKVAGYVRVSTFEQAEKGTSIDVQKKLIVEECNKRGWLLTGIYCDEGISGKITDRQGLRDLQSDALAGIFSIIMFTKSDRLTRSVRDLCNLWHDWTEAGFKIICIEQPEINSEGICGKLIRNLLGIFAEWERDAIIERTTSGRLARWKNIEAIIGALPYGYDHDAENKKIILNPEKKAICKRIFNMYLNQNLAARDIAIRLAKASVQAPRSNSCNWQYATILKILKNPAYAGRADYNMYKYVTLIGKNNQPYVVRSKEKKDRAKWITIKFPPIISENQHLRVLDRLKLRSRKYDRIGDYYSKTFLLENIVFYCGECGGKMKMNVMRRKNSRSYNYYRCCWNLLSAKDIKSLYKKRGRCDMRVDSTTTDNYIFSHVMEFLSSIVNCARHELMDLSLIKIMQKFNDGHTALSTEHKSILQRCSNNSHIDNWDLKYISDTEMKHIRNCRNRYSGNGGIINRNYGNVKRKYDLINTFDDDILKISSSQLIRHEKADFSDEISCYIDAISFDQKKNIIESVIAPDKGGECFIRWAKQSDMTCDIAPLKLEENRFYPGSFRIHPLVIEITFFASLNKIQKLVWGLHQSGPL